MKIVSSLMVHDGYVHLGKKRGHFFSTTPVLKKILDSLERAHVRSFREHIGVFSNCNREATSPLVGATDKKTALKIRKNFKQMNFLRQSAGVSFCLYKSVLIHMRVEFRTPNSKLHNFSSVENHAPAT